MEITAHKNVQLDLKRCAYDVSMGESSSMKKLSHKGSAGALGRDDSEKSFHTCQIKAVSLIFFMEMELPASSFTTFCTHHPL
jgi:hypothetical protein